MHDLPVPGTIVAGKYRVESLLGEGGMSTVFRAHHELMDKPVALKWLRPELSARPEAKDRFMREARASARLKHPNVVDVHDVGVHEGALFLVMELMEGESFAQLIEHGSISIPSAIRLLIGAMEGVATAHEHGIVHRDIKPENIFVVKNRVYPDGIAKILDFGISKLSDDRGGQSLTKTGHTVGTPEYMSMEQMTGEADVDARADVYSFGVLLYRALTGHSPFSGETFAAIAVKVATTNPLPPRELRPDLPAALEQVVMKAMARNREHRYPTMRALIDALSFLGSTQGFLSQMPHPASGAPLLTPTPQGLRDLLPFSNFRADTVELAPPTKALTEPSLARRPQRPRKSHALPILLSIGFVAGASMAAWRFWPAPSSTASSGTDDAAQAATNSGSAGTGASAQPNEQDRPLAQQPQERGPNNSGAEEWDSPVVAPVRVEVQAVDVQPAAEQPSAVVEAFRETSPHEAKPARRQKRESGHRSSGSNASTSTALSNEAPKPAADPTPQPSSSSKSATGRRSGTLRSDDF